MAADGNTDTKPEVQRAVAAGTDLSQGSEKAYEALKQEVDSAQAKYGANTPEFNRFGADVAKGLAQSGALEEMSEQWARHNLDQVATSDQRHIKPADLNPQFGTNALEQAFLGSLAQNYSDLQQRAGKTGWGNTRNEFGEKELDHVLASRQAERDQAEQARMAQEAAARQQAKFTDVTTKLLANDGNPNDSLFAVLDGIKSGDGKLDGKISHSDLKRFEQDFAVRAARGDFGFTQENLKEVRTLDREWNEPLGRALRGVDSDGNANGNISIEATSASLGVSPDHLFAAYSQPGAPGRRGSMANVDANAQPVEGSAAIPAGAAGGFDANGNPIAAAGPTDRSAAAPVPPGVQPSDASAGAPVPPGVQQGDSGASTYVPPGVQPGDSAAGPSGAGPTDSRVAQAGPAPGQGGFDANGNPIAASGQPGDQSAPPVPPGVTDNRAAGPQNAGGQGGFDANGNPIAAGATGDGTGQPPQQRNVGTDGRPVPAGQPGDANTTPPPPGSNTDATPSPAPGASGDAAPHTPHRHLKPATDDSGKPVHLADIDTAPALDMPVLKAGDDPNKVAADFLKAAVAHFQADAVYTVKPGQGWDRIARDTLRKSGDDAAGNEHSVEQFSDQIAKMNGVTGGRLDSSVTLQPGDQVRVRDDAWVKAQVEKAMSVFAQKLTDATKPAASTTTQPTETKNLYDDSRNGGGDITPGTAPNAPQNATGDASTPAPPKDASAKPAGTDNQTQQPGNGADASLNPAPPPDASTLNPAKPGGPGDSGPPPIPKDSAPATPVADNSAANPANPANPGPNPNADAATADANARKQAGQGGAIDVTNIDPAEVS